jgi:hypothetical protein
LYLQAILDLAVHQCPHNSIDSHDFCCHICCHVDYFQDVPIVIDTKLRPLKAKEKPYSISDGHGLHIEVRPTGAKYWRQNYRYNGKQKKLAHGTYPLVSLADAREKRDQALKYLQNGNDSSKLKRQEKLKLKTTFGEPAKEWHDKESANWKPIHP